jgi:hypothetical protein
MDTDRDTRSNGESGRERHGVEPTTVAGARLEIAATRTRLSGTVAELEQQLSDRIDGVKEKVSVVALVRRHPWAALASAFVAGVALSTSGADRRAAHATTRAAKRTPELAKRGASAAASATAAGVSHLASAAVARIKGAPDDRRILASGAQDSGGLTAKTLGELKTQVRELNEEAERGVDELASSLRPRRNTNT